MRCDPDRYPLDHNFVRSFHTREVRVRWCEPELEADLSPARAHWDRGEDCV